MINKQDIEYLTISKRRTTLPKILTFADAVNKQQQEARLKSKRSSQNLERQGKHKKISLLEIESLMESCIKMIEKAIPTVLQKIETYIHCDCKGEVKQEMTRWKDDHRLNLVHYAIIYKRPEIVHYLLAESCVFPPDSKPAICPYAHLAAYLGSTASLKIILTERPEDYFKTRLPEHDILLPFHIIQSFAKPIGKTKTHYDEVLKSINLFKQSEVSRPVSANVRSDDLNELITHLQKIWLEDPNTKRSLLPPINPRKRRSTYSHNRIVKPVAYDKLFLDSISQESSQYSLEKTPLTLAAERGHADTVTAILETLFSRRMPHIKSVSFGPLLRATKALSPEAITTLLEIKEISNSDYQDSVLEAIRYLLPDCLIALLSNPPKKSNLPFGGMNLYHMVYTQCLDADDDRYQMLPLMTRALVYCREDVNSYTLPQTFPLYSLIASSFNVSSTKRLYHTFECLRILFAAGANPFFNETASKPKLIEDQHVAVSRPAYTSIFHCIFENAIKSLERHENSDVPLVIMKNSIMFALEMNKMRHKVLDNAVLFQYLEKACYLGLDKQILIKMLSSGADPNATIEEKYSLNIYFEAFFRYVLEFERNQTHDYYKKEMAILIILCEHMTPDCLKKAVKILLNQYIRRIPVEAVPVTRYFLYLVDNLVKQRMDM